MKNITGEVRNSGDSRCGRCDIIELGTAKNLEKKKELKVDANMNCKTLKKSYLLHYMPTVEEQTGN